jgi:hypothetical protein
MFESKALARSLTLAAGVAADKRANALNHQDDEPVDNVALQEIIGDPDTYPLSWSTQFRPSEGVPSANPLAPGGGDEVFFSGLFDGARLQANDQSWWDVEEYNFEGAVTIRNVWYPRTIKVISIQELRACIHSWIEPFLQRVPPPPPGAEYGVLEVREA